METTMKRILRASAVVLALAGRVAVAQTSPLPPAPPPAGTLSTTRTTVAVDAYGNRLDQRQTTYRNNQGVAEDTRTTTTTTTPPPPPPPITTTTTTTNSTTGPQ
jgi:hypothetical protein